MRLHDIAINGNDHFEFDLAFKYFANSINAAHENLLNINEYHLNINASLFNINEYRDVPDSGCYQIRDYSLISQPDSGIAVRHQEIYFDLKKKIYMPLRYPILFRKDCISSNIGNLGATLFSWEFQFHVQVASTNFFCSSELLTMENWIIATLSDYMILICHYQIEYWQSTLHRDM